MSIKMSKAVLFLDQTPATMTVVNKDSYYCSNTEAVKEWLQSTKVKKYLCDNYEFRNPYIGAIMVFDNIIFSVFTKATCTEYPTPHNESTWEFDCSGFGKGYKFNGLYFHNNRSLAAQDYDPQYLTAFENMKKRNENLIETAMNILNGHSGAISDDGKIVVPDSAPLTLKVGDRVKRGPDWQYDNQDDNGLGSVSSSDGISRWTRVKWDNGSTNTYRYGQVYSKDTKFYKEIVLA